MGGAVFSGEVKGATMTEYIVRESVYPGTIKQEIVGEIVRCKDCKYREGSACDYSAVYVRPNGYCQWGERREDE